jgi:hypothetical protein
VALIFLPPAEEGMDHVRLGWGAEFSDVWPQRRTGVVAVRQVPSRREVEALAREGSVNEMAAFHRAVCRGLRTMIRSCGFSSAV